MVDFFEGAADVLIFLLSGWVGFSFWRVYQRTGNARSLLLAVTFAILSAFKALQFLLEVVFQLEPFAWMDSVLALEVMSIIILFGLAFSLRTSPGWKGRIRKK